jgi:hypothetical protein
MVRYVDGRIHRDIVNPNPVTAALAVLAGATDV